MGRSLPVTTFSMARPTCLTAMTFRQFRRCGKFAPPSARHSQPRSVNVLHICWRHTVGWQGSFERWHHARVQLLPHPVTNWIVDINGRPLDRDLFFVGTWIAYKWSVLTGGPRDALRHAFHAAEGQHM